MDLHRMCVHKVLDSIPHPHPKNKVLDSIPTHPPKKKDGFGWPIASNDNLDRDIFSLFFISCFGRFAEILFTTYIHWRDIYITDQLRKAPRTMG